MHTLHFFFTLFFFFFISPHLMMFPNFVCHKSCDSRFFAFNIFSFFDMKEFVLNSQWAYTLIQYLLTLDAILIFDDDWVENRSNFLFQFESWKKKFYNICISKKSSSWEYSLLNKIVFIFYLPLAFKSTTKCCCLNKTTRLSAWISHNKQRHGNWWHNHDVSIKEIHIYEWMNEFDNKWTSDFMVRSDCSSHFVTIVSRFSIHSYFVFAMLWSPNLFF